MTTALVTPEEPKLDHGIEENPVRPAPRFAWLIVLLASFAASAALFAALGFSIVGVIIVGYVIYLIAVTVTYSAMAGRRKGTDQLMRSLIYGAFVLALIPLVSVLWTVISIGAPAISADFLTKDMSGLKGVVDKAVVEQGAPLQGGALHAILGTLIITAIATLVSVPIGLFTAIYLVEYGKTSRLAKSIRFFVDVMTGIPSIVAGLFAFSLFTILFGVGTRNGVAGAIALAVLMIPTVVRNSEEMLRIVPNELREASLALGVPVWKTVTKIVIPTAASGLASGVTLAIARVIGETAPLLLAVGATNKTNVDPFNGPMNTLAVYAYSLFKFPLNPGYRDPSLERAWGAVLLLVIFVVLLNLLARFIAKVFAPKTGR